MTRDTWTQLNTDAPADAELVRRAVRGDAGAFDTLVLRHRQGVLSAARSVLGNRDEAEDAAQQAFLDAFANLADLREPERFRAWLMTIAKRRALRRGAGLVRWPDALGSVEAVICPLWSAQPDPSHDDLRDRVRAALDELSARSRRVVTLHYLDGYACREIGLRLDMSEGAVKRVLHESRNNLRVSMGIGSQMTMGGKKRMETTKKTKPGPRHLVFWINGNWPGPFMDSTLAQSITLSANKEPRTLAQLSKLTDANPEYVREAIGPLVHEGLVVEEEPGRFRTGFIALDAADWIELSKDVRKQAVVVVDALLPRLSELESAWNKSPKPSQGFAWTEGIWPTLALLLLNVALSRHGDHRGQREAPLHSASGKRYWPGGQEEVAPEHVLWCTGFSIDSGESFGYGNFWSHGLSLRWSGTTWPGDTKQALAAIANGATDPDAVAAATGQAPEHAREVLAQALEVELVRRAGDKLALTFPVFRHEDDEALLPVIDEIAERLTCDILRTATAGIPDLLCKLGYGHLEEQFPEWRRWLDGNVAGEVLREMLSRGILPHPGDPAPMGFCRMGWVGGARVMQWEA